MTTQHKTGIEIEQLRPLPRCTCKTIRRVLEEVASMVFEYYEKWSFFFFFPNKTSLLQAVFGIRNGNISVLKNNLGASLAGPKRLICDN